jgi:hypothetical protein
MQGGTLMDVTITGSTIQNSEISGSTLSGCTLTNLVAVDDASLRTIINAMTKLSDAELRPLADALHRVATVEAAGQPAGQDGAVLGTTVIGDRATLLGKPSSWVKLGSKSLPAYDA